MTGSAAAPPLTASKCVCVQCVFKWMDGWMDVCAHSFSFACFLTMHTRTHTHNRYKWNRDHVKEILRGDGPSSDHLLHMQETVRGVGCALMNVHECVDVCGRVRRWRWMRRMLLRREATHVPSWLRPYTHLPVHSPTTRFLRPQNRPSRKANAAFHLTRREPTDFCVANLIDEEKVCAWIDKVVLRVAS